jgi:hypothetical protein
MVPRPEIPKLVLSLELGAKVTPTSNCSILGTLHRLDSHSAPYLFLWSQLRNALTSNGFQLLRHTDNRLLEIEMANDIAARPLKRDPNDTIVMVQTTALRELFTDGRIGKSR